MYCLSPLRKLFFTTKYTKLNILISDICVLYKNPFCPLCLSILIFRSGLIASNSNCINAVTFVIFPTKTITFRHKPITINQHFATKKRTEKSLFWVYAILFCTFAPCKKAVNLLQNSYG